jgi:hypothetical protein
MFETFEEFVIVGGVPVLRGGREDLVHPGTRDFDVLFSTHDSGAVRGAAENLLRRGFIPSAKHEFQLLHPIRVGERDFLFNIDLMHPAEQIEKPESYDDLFDLGLPDLNDPTGKRWLKSIVFESANIVFDQKLWSNISIVGIGIDRQPVDVQIPLLDEVGFILSKTKSVRQVKRPRDSPTYTMF